MRSSVIDGSAGRYVSIVSGPSAMSEPRTRTSRSRAPALRASPGCGTAASPVGWSSTTPCGASAIGALSVAGSIAWLESDSERADAMEPLPRRAGAPLPRPASALATGRGIGAAPARRQPAPVTAHSPSGAGRDGPRHACVTDVTSRAEAVRPARRAGSEGAGGGHHALLDVDVDPRGAEVVGDRVAGAVLADDAQLELACRRELARVVDGLAEVVGGRR